MFCIHCGNQMPDDARFCPACGGGSVTTSRAAESNNPIANTYNNPSPNYGNNSMNQGYGNYNNGFLNNGYYGDVSVRSSVSDKSQGLALLLCFFFGWLGFHRLYIGKAGSGVCLLLLGILGWLTAAIIIGIPMLIICGLVEFIDFFRLLFNALPDGEGRKLK